MMRTFLFAATLMFGAAVAPVLSGAPQNGDARLKPGPTTSDARPKPGPTAGVPDAAFVQQYCLTCHSARVKSGGLVLEGLDPSVVAGQADVWEKVVRKLRTGMMPPDGAPRPAAAVRETFTATLEATLDRASAGQSDPGAPALHRLNRTEYSNVIRDLIALDVDVNALLPPDDAAAGFDNIADVLGVSPGLIEGYVAAAAKISRLALGDPSLGLDRVVYRVPGDLEQDVHLDGLPLGTRGGIVIRHTFPLDAEYDLQVGQAGGGPPRWAADARSASGRSLRRHRWCSRDPAGTRPDATEGDGRSACHCRRADRSFAHGGRGWRVSHRGAHARHYPDHRGWPEQPDRTRQHAQSPSRADLLADVQRRRSRLCDEDPGVTRDPGLSPADRGRRAGGADAARVLP